MNRTLVFATALAIGLTSTNLFAQTHAAEPAHTASHSAASETVTPEAVPTKVAIIAFEQAVVATNEGQRAVQTVQKKYDPQKAQIDSLSAEVDSLKKQLQALPANTTDDERATRERDIDGKEKQLQLDAQNASTAYQADLQDAYGKVARKVGATAVKYAQDHGFTLLLNVGGQQESNPVLWFEQKTDITQAVINAYNVSSGVTAPPPSAPSPHRSAPAATHHQ